MSNSSSQIQVNTDRQKSNHRFLKAAVLVVLMVAGIIAGSGFYYAATAKALPGTMIGKVNVGGMSQRQIADRLTQMQNTVKVSFVVPGKGEHSSSLSDIGYRIDAAQTARKVMELNHKPLSYLRALSGGQAIEPVVKLNPLQTNQLSQRLSKNVENAVSAQEPSVTLREDGTAFQINQGKPGFGVTTKSLLAGAKVASDKMSNTTWKAEVGAIDPLLPVSAAQRLQVLAEKASQVEISVKGLVGQEEKTFTADANLRRSWIRIPQVNDHAQPTVDTGKVMEWLLNQQKNVEIPVVEGKRYLHQDGKVVKVSKEAKDGLKITNTDQLARGIEMSFAQGKNFSGEFVTEVAKGTWKDKVIDYGSENLAYMAAPGEKWYDINLSNHTITAYEGAKVWKGPVAMVNGAPATPTVTGVFKIDRRYRSKTMRGFNADGTPYVTENVPYAQYFHGGYALHGAPWRSSFGYAGDAGSHGCINLPVSVARQFYSWSTLGTVVVSHH